MKRVNNFNSMYSDGVKSCFTSFMYKGVYIHTCYNMTYDQNEVKCRISLETGEKFAYMGKSTTYCKKLIRDLVKLIPNWYSLEKK